MQWKTREFRETFGEVSFRVEALENLERTIDTLFEELEVTGDPRILEDLCPYFGCVWPSARALAEFLFHEPLEVEGAKSVLEVGCGLAIPSWMVLRRTRLSVVTASDFHPEVPKFLERNLALNFTKAELERFRYLALDWRTPPADLDRYHWVIGSDILYEKDHPENVADALCRLAKANGRITIADPGRPYLQRFIDEMKARGWSAEPKIVDVAGTEPGSRKEIYLFDFRPIRR